MGYKEDREAAYPTVQDQLDQIFQDLKNSSDLRDGEWYKTIAKIKADHEKPQEEGGSGRPSRRPSRRTYSRPRSSTRRR